MRETSTDGRFRWQLLASVGLAFVNEYKAAKTAEALHSRTRERF